MYYPIGWHKVLRLDTNSEHDEHPCKILSVQANHERELYFILTSRSIHIWFPRPAAEIVCHRRSNESIEQIGLNKSAVWRTDSSVIVIATERDQLLFFQIRKRVTSSSTWSFLISNSSDDEGIYRLKQDSKSSKRARNSRPSPDSNNMAHIPALTMFSFGKLDLSSVGISCLMSAEEELIVGTRTGQIYGVHWDGNVDDKFPWSLSKGVFQRSDFAIDIKFSSVLSGFSFVFKSGRVGFMPLQINQDECPENEGSISYLASITNATCTEMNHRHRLVAFGLKDSRVIVCSIGDSNSTLVDNHTLEWKTCKNQNNNNVSNLGQVECLKYSPDNFVIAVSWDQGGIALWTVFGSLLFCSYQWQPECGLNVAMKTLRSSSLAWGREGYNLWLCMAKNDNDLINDTAEERNSTILTNGKQTVDGDRISLTASSQSTFGSAADSDRGDIIIMSLVRSNLSTSPHQSCSADSLILIGEERIYIGPSIPHEDKFDHWIVVNFPLDYLNANYPIRYATVDRNCKNLAIAGNRGFSICTIKPSKWIHFKKKSQADSLTVCGDMIWWHDYLIVACFNFENELFELRAYPTTGVDLDNSQAIVKPTVMEIIRMSIFENRLLVLYSDGTLGMFMLNLRQKPINRKQVLNRPSNLARCDSISSASGRLTQDLQKKAQQQLDLPRSNRSGSVMSLGYSFKNLTLSESNLVVEISSIENLCISNLKANPFCISSLALTRLHFKNYRNDDSILLNACGKLFLLEREVPSDLSSEHRTNSSSPDQKGLSLDDSQCVNSNLEMKVQSAKIMNNSAYFASASLKSTLNEPSALSNVTFKAVSVIATNVEQFWISPEISIASEMSYFKKSLWLSCGDSTSRLKVWLPLLNDENDPPTDLYVPDRIMLPVKCDIYPLAIRSSAADLIEPDDAIVLGAESDVLYRDCKLFTYFPYTNVKRQCRVYLHRILRELLLGQHLGYYARKIAESCQTLPYFAHCFELLLHEVLEEEATSPVPLPDPMLPQVVKFIREFPVYLETVVHCARKSELSMWSYLFDERAVGNPKKLFQECIEKQKFDTAASCLIILQSLDKNTISSRMVKELIRLVRENPKFVYLVEDLESFLARAELDGLSLNGSPRESPNM